MNRTTRASLTLAILAAALASLGAAATASAAPAPAIGQEWVSHVKSNDATLEALIDPQEASPGAVYQFQLVKEPSEYPPEIQCPPHWGGFSTCVGTHSATALPIGLVPATSQDVQATLNLASAGITLQPGTTYHYRVLAAHRIFTEDTLEWEEPIVFGTDQTFTTLPAEAPSIEGISASSITKTDATLEAQINTEGLATTYEFHLVTAPPCASGECPQQVFPLPSGKLLGSFVPQSVSLELNSAGVTLHPGERYEYWLTAANSAGSAGSQTDTRTFTAAEEEIPSIAGEGTSHVTATDATLEAAINPHGAAAGDYYQFQLVRDPSEYAAEILCPPTLHPGIDGCAGSQGANALPIGWVPGDLANPLAAQPVQLDLASAGVTLQPGTTYHYRVLAARRVVTEDTIQWEPPTVYGADQTFTTPSEPPPNAQTGGTDGQLPAVQSPPSTAPSHHRRHHKRHKRELHQSKLHRAGRPG